ncbi:S1C family serine protease [Haliangium sp.]|uniref:S1C family serine protease n=1 Tax=Haliangium sp. TaxID=2663208 RepID=UPI003D0E9D1E
MLRASSNRPRDRARAGVGGTGRAGLASAAIWVVALSLVAGACRLRSEAEPEPAPAPAPAPPPGPVVADAATPEVTAPIPTPERSGIARVGYPPQPIERLVEDLRRTVVNVRAEAPVKDGPAAIYPGSPGADDVSLGSGFVVMREGSRAHILTNAHILEQADEIRVALAGGAEVPAVILGRDAQLDVALLSIETNAPLTVARLGDSTNLRVGERVVALGNPFGLEVTASAGIISSVDGAAGEIPRELAPAHYRSFLITDAAIHAGNSGGPLVDVAGRVIGLNVATDPRGGALGFAVPISRIEAVLGTLEREGRVLRTWLGLYIQPVTAEVAAQYGLDGPRGALVTDVPPETPAARAGLLSGDIILRFDGRVVDHRNLPWLVSTAGPNRTVAVEVWRARGLQTLDVITELRPE